MHHLPYINCKDVCTELLKIIASNIIYFQLKCLIFWLNTGLNIILISRTPYKLQNVAAEIEEKYSGVKTKIIEVDFAKEDSTSYIPKIEESIKAQWPIFIIFAEGLKIRGFTLSFNGFFCIKECSEKKMTNFSPMFYVTKGLIFNLIFSRILPLNIFVEDH